MTLNQIFITNPKPSQTFGIIWNGYYSDKVAQKLDYKNTLWDAVYWNKSTCMEGLAYIFNIHNYLLSTSFVPDLVLDASNLPPKRIYKTSFLFQLIFYWEMTERNKWHFMLENKNNKARNKDKECLVGVMGGRVRDVQGAGDIWVKI